MIESWQILDLLSALVEKSLVVYEEDQNGVGRYRLLETVRQYARDRLLECDETETTRGRHRDWFAEYAVRMDSRLKGREAEQGWGEAEPEYPNLRAALEWSIAGQDERSLEAALGLLRPLAIFWRLRGNVSEGREVYASILSCVRESAAATPALARLGQETLYQAGHLANRQSDYVAARALFEESLRLSRERGDTSSVAQSLNNLGYVAMYEGNLDTARTQNEEALQIYQISGDPIGVGSVLYSLGLIAHIAGHYEEARTHYEDALTSWGNRAEGQTGVPYILLNLGHAARHTGDLARARSCYEGSLRRFVPAADRRGIAQSPEAFASLAAGAGTAVEPPVAERAARLYGAAQNIRDALNTPLPAIARALHEEPMSAARAALGEEAFAAAWAEGRALTTEQAVAEALNADE